MSMYIARILHDRRKAFLIIIVILIPVLEVVQILYQMKMGDDVPNPHYATFLALYTLRHYLHKILFWFLPLFLLFIANEDSLEDYDLRYRNILVVRSGKSSYIKTKLTGSFLISAGIICLGLLFNMLLIYILFREGTYQKDDYSDYLYYDISKMTVPNPVISNLVYIVLTSFLAGLLGTVGAALSIVLKDRRIVYGLTFLLWFIPVMSKQSLMYVIQPFISVNYAAVMPTLTGLILCYCVIIASSVYAEVTEDDL